jgi:hypothetical protein
MLHFFGQFKTKLNKKSQRVKSKSHKMTFFDFSKNDFRNKSVGAMDISIKGAIAKIKNLT